MCTSRSSILQLLKRDPPATEGFVVNQETYKTTGDISISGDLERGREIVCG